ncbi:uncharacterized protein J7T54_007151 [Emericellopsis cladophorae]|uniref:LYR motif-containing protein Cup1-like N-terminal domain-containing protein n=1 Tax=Emericellopsis cladophorae TaxID=2686198 RepID=A0A9P9Y8U5_9HYPO|nr:uncharacterized protein J7T54_007151 [Emericellopsis cladophorae]KAI6785508.1 hypothetical protein J7T54_007151 [Emericellopsis cladophorae]
MFQPAPSHPLHLYRHLLRQTSYLPPVLSPTFRARLRRTFRQNRYQKTHVPRRIARAKASLRTLSAANNGDSKCMRHLIDEGFGRSGKRRATLLRQFLVPEGPQDSDALEALTSGNQQSVQRSTAATEGEQNPEATHLKSKKQKYGFLQAWDRPKLLRFLKSQKDQMGAASADRGVLWNVGDIKSVKEDNEVPELNKWGKPPGETLVRAKQAKFWKRNVEKILPPLGRGEWEMLEKLSIGLQAEGDKEYRIPDKRTPAKTADAAWDWKEYAVKPTSHIERAAQVKQRQRHGDLSGNPYLGRAKRDSVSDRWYRRTYGQAWRKSAYVEVDPNKLKKKFAWGGAPPLAPGPAPEQMDVFQGVRARGEVSSKGRS